MGQVLVAPSTRPPRTCGPCLGLGLWLRLAFTARRLVFLPDFLFNELAARLWLSRRVIDRVAYAATVCVA